MKRIGLIFLLTTFPLVAHGFGIYKCVGGSNVAYQNFPCAPGLEEMPLGPPATPARPSMPSVAATPQQLASAAKNAPSASAQVAAAESASAMSSVLPFRTGPLKVGMSDDEVLNL